MKLLRLVLPSSLLLLAACSSLDGTPFEIGELIRVTEQTPIEISYEYTLQWPSLLPKTAERAEQHCQANGRRSAVEFHRWGGGPITNFVTYRCIQKV